jgi:hypothetical protein
MSGSINLVSPKNEQLEKEQNRLKIARISAFVIMLCVAGIAVLVFVINLTLPLNAIKHNEDITLSNISTLQKKLTQYSLVEDRVNHVSNIIGQRQKLPDVVGVLVNTVPSDLSVNSIQVDSKNISLDISGSSLTSMNELIDNIIMLSQQQKMIKNVVMQQLSLDVKSSRYSISIQANTE